MKKQIKRYFAFMREHPIWGTILTIGCLHLFVYGSTKKQAVSDFSVESNPDEVVAKWNEPDKNLVVTAAFLQRRLKGVTEDEGWETVGQGELGNKEVRVEGFTLDKDYEYRLRYIYEEID